MQCKNHVPDFSLPFTASIGNGNWNNFTSEFWTTQGRDRTEWPHCNGAELAWSITQYIMSKLWVWRLIDDPMHAWTSYQLWSPHLCSSAGCDVTDVEKMWVDVQFSSLDFSNAMGHRWSLLRTKMYVLLLLHSSPCHTEFCTGFFGSSGSCCMHSYPCFGERVFLNLFSACLIQWASRQFLQ